MRYKRSRTDIHSLPRLKTFRRELRSHLTPAEARLWTLLKNSRLDGRKFRRQHSVGGYVLDFYCPSEKLAVELDGYRHFTAAGRLHDHERRLFLEHFGINVIRFENEWVFKYEEWVLDGIRAQLGWQQRTTPPAEAAGTPPS
jgi:very-short-patch-repair endonuclease